MIEELESDIVDYIKVMTSVTMAQLKKSFSDYDTQEISEAIQQLMKVNRVRSSPKDGTIAYSIISQETQQKLTIDQVNSQIEEIKAKLKPVEINDFDLKISALKKIGEIMADDIQELLHEICDDLQATQA